MAPYAVAPYSMLALILARFLNPHADNNQSFDLPELPDDIFTYRGALAPMQLWQHQKGPSNPWVSVCPNKFCKECVGISEKYPGDSNGYSLKRV